MVLNEFEGCLDDARVFVHLCEELYNVLGLDLVEDTLEACANFLRLFGCGCGGDCDVESLCHGSLSVRVFLNVEFKGEVCHLAA